MSSGVSVRVVVLSNGGMRTLYHENLEGLSHQLRAMCLHARAVVATATGALLKADLSEAERAIDLGAEMDAMRERCEREAVRLLALQAPVAGELRQVVTAIQLVGDLVRMGALAGHIAEVARRRHPVCAVPASAEAVVTRMGSVAVAIATSAAAVLASGDPDDAAQLDTADDIMDRLHQGLLAAILAEGWDHGTTAAVDLTLVGRYYERFADHAVEVGRRTIFITTGHYPDDHEDDEP